MVGTFSALFYAERLTPLQWRLLQVIAKVPPGAFWALPRGYSDAIGQTIRDLKEQKLIVSCGYIGDIEAGDWCYTYSCSADGHEAVRLLTDTERIAVFPHWGKWGVASQEAAA